MEYLWELVRLFLMFAKIGLFTIGGGYAMLPLIQGDLVANGLMTSAETTDMVAISQMTPGPFAVNAATFTGMRLYGVPGAVAATLGVILPSVVITLLAAKFFFSFHKTPMVNGVLHTLRPVVLGLILYSALHIAIESVWVSGGNSAGYVDWLVLTLAALALTLLLTVKKISPIALILLCGLAGVCFEFFPDA